MTTISFPSNTKTIIDAIRGAIGRDVTLYYVYSSYACTEPSCAYDPINETSTNSFCQVCSGNYYIPIYSGYTVSGHITWGHSDQMNWNTGGQYFEGDCRVQIEYTAEAITIVDKTEWIEVDSKIMDIRKRIYRGVQPLNRILLDCIERE